jgi:endonuclease YncB( thermonuclease family)
LGNRFDPAHECPMIRTFFALVVFVVELADSIPGFALEVTGYSTIIDGDTLEIGTTRVRLEGIDAPESAQKCQLPTGTWDCGSIAELALSELTAGRIVNCRGDETDNYGRLLATCSTANEPNINAKLVSEGLAWAFVRYSSQYVGQEASARELKKGIWQAKTQPPWQYRERRWDTATKASPHGCPIKGNINRNGERIYHTPWSRDYTRTRINVAIGERWFCNENEALAAGWRPPKR